MSVEKSHQPYDGLRVPREITREQAAAMVLELTLAKKIINDRPDIDYLYRNGMNYGEIAIALEIVRAEVTLPIARGAVKSALFGFPGVTEGQWGKIEPFDGLITDPKEAHQLRLEHQLKRVAEAGKIGGITNRDRRIGIFGRTPDEIRQDATANGIATYRAGVGVHAMTTEELSQAGKKAAIKQGKRPWTTEEEAEIERMTRDSSYLRKTKGERRQFQTARMAQEINEKFHQGQLVRNWGSVSAWISRHLD